MTDTPDLLVGDEPSMGVRPAPTAPQRDNPWTTTLGLAWMSLFALAGLLWLIAITNTGGGETDAMKFAEADYRIAEISFASSGIAAAFGGIAALLHIAVKAVQWSPR